jgi:hypothetical protein
MQIMPAYVMKQQIASDSPTHILLIEADPDAREHRADLLRTAGYTVAASGGLPSLAEASEADVIIADEPSFQWLQDQPTRCERTFIVLTDDVKAGVSACLCGAADWTPLGGDSGYLLSVLADVCRDRR